MEPPAPLLLGAQTDDPTVFAHLVQPYRRELLIHCYRMLGSYQDAEDIVQETWLRAWEKRATFTAPGSYRAWLYRIATNLCLNVLTRQPRRVLPNSMTPVHDPARPLPTRQREPIWLEPFPDEGLADEHGNPEEYVVHHEDVTLAFLVALHHLTPAQRAILLLREVLEWPAQEVATWLHLSVAAVNSGLQRARRTLRAHHPHRDTAVHPCSAQSLVLLQRYMALWEEGDIPALVALLQEDAWFTMPPIPAWFQGQAAIATLLQASILTPAHQWRVDGTQANGSPACALYLWQPDVHSYQLFGLMVLDIVHDRIASIVTFLEVSHLIPFALPPSCDPVIPIRELSPTASSDALARTFPSSRS